MKEQNKEKLYGALLYTIIFAWYTTMLIAFITL